MSTKKVESKQANKTTNKRRRGSVLLYGVAVMSTMCGLASLAADYGRVQMTKMTLHSYADAAARAGAGGLAVDRATAISYAQKIVVANTTAATPDCANVTLDTTQDIQIGLWTPGVNGAAGTFVVLGSTSTVQPNAVHVTLHRSQARGNAVPLLFGKLLGSNFCDVSAEAIAQYIQPINVNQNVLATANPFLSGAAAGTQASNPNPHGTIDYAGTTSNPMQSPQGVSIPLDPNQPLTFDAISGTARHDPNMADYEPDGELDNVGHNNLTTDENGDYASNFYNQNGVADMNCPINALVGIFLDDSAPSVSSAPTPANLDFSSQASRDFTTLKPQLKQLFFIGDGLTSTNQVQSFYPPKGATRLFLATWDFYEWNNNSGSRTVKVARPSKIMLVK